MTFKDKLKELMAAQSLSERELAQRADVAQGTLHNYLIGRRAPSFEAVVKLARALGTTCEEFANCQLDYEEGRDK